MLGDSMSFGPMLISLFKQESPPEPLITSKGDNLASPHMVVNLPLDQCLDKPVNALRQRIVQDFTNLFPFILLAKMERPMPSIHEYTDLLSGKQK